MTAEEFLAATGYEEDQLEELELYGLPADLYRHVRRRGLSVASYSQATGVVHGGTFVPEELS
ncbi:hypothetical protein [Rhodococcus jostii]|uniref:hypothetical protein n=1 Tax=Rhodococcus jostii TaxID=132919 RepID=UPI0036610B7B